MLHQTLTYIKDYLIQAFKQPDKDDQTQIEIGAVDKDNTQHPDLLITLLNIEEERITKQQHPYLYNGEPVKSAGEANPVVKIETINPEIKLNLYVLITSQAGDYSEALKKISKVIGIFQQKYLFSGEDVKGYDKLDRLAFDLYPLTLDQNNSLWQTFGVKMMPHVIYKIRMLTVQTDTPVIVKPIEEVRVKDVPISDRHKRVDDE